MLNLSFQLKKSYHLWFYILEKPFGTGVEAAVSSNFDYEMRNNKKWVYIDLGIKLNYAYVVYRSGFELKSKGLTWAQIFNSDTIKAMLKIAIEETQKGYIIFCQANQLQLPVSCTIPESIIEPFSNTILDQYIQYRSIDDKKNDYLINTIILECEAQSAFSLIFNCTFFILQEVLFYDYNFNNEQNREIFSNVIPLPRYFTIKENCNSIDIENVRLSGYDMVMFFQCLDCALQMLLGDKADFLISFLERIGYDAEEQAEFIQIATNEFANLKQMLADSNARITNLENRVDWINLLK